ncbi:peptidase S9 [Actinoplanes sp. OR16]|uniref:S9 family peptidase n=1 Tax=Actinoplanes sp. OR16 TaxID=946334 RepID=UPI000F6FF820|nr:prolyl oligopeptidase family serine peptidase [Actinoplanes sp. OR16]BBH63962.1 peptidase S9 [Actinoplanes sp. OR16]
MGGQLSRVDVTVLPVGWSDPSGPRQESEVAGNWSPTLSPDGRHLAYVSDRGGVPAVWVQPVGSDLTFRVDTGPEPVAAVRWSSGGGWLACEITPGGAPRHEIWLVRPDGSDLHQVAGFGADTAENMRWLPGRPVLALTENLTTAVLIDVVQETRTVVARGELLALLDMDPAGRFALLRYGPRGAREIVLRDLGSGVEKPVTRGERAVFSPGGGCVYALSQDGERPVLLRIDGDAVEAMTGDRPTGVARLAMKERSPTAAAGTVTDRSATDEPVGMSPGEVEDFAVTADGRTSAVLWNVRGGESEVALIGLDHDGDRVPELISPLPGLVVGELAWSFDGSTLAFTAEGPGQPHGVWVWDRATGRVSAVSADAAAPDAVRPTLEVFPAHDGLTLTGWLFRPRTAGPHPTVLWLHGGPEAQERPGHGPLFQSLVNRGIAVFAANVRGSSGFGRSFVDADNGALRYAAIEDVRTCAGYLRDSGVSTSLGCMGRSYGGYLTLAALTTFPDLFDVGIDVCGMSDFETFYRHTEPWIAAAAVSKYGDPVRDADLLRDLSPMTRIDRLRTPLLVVHGENDSNVPVIEAEQVVKALAERGVEHRYLLFPGEGHELLHRSSRAEYLREVLAWLETHLVTVEKESR